MKQKFNSKSVSGGMNPLLQLNKNGKMLERRVPRNEVVEEAEIVIESMEIIGRIKGMEIELSEEIVVIGNEVEVVEIGMVRDMEEDRVEVDVDMVVIVLVGVEVEVDVGTIIRIE